MSKLTRKTVAIGTAAALDSPAVLHPQHLTTIIGFRERILNLSRHTQGIARQGQR